MAVKIRLTRHGRKRFAFYHIIVADSRAPRDGRYIERIGTYNPNTDPATIDLEFEKALRWLENGAQPTDTVRAILSYKGVLYRKHLAGGVKKGSFTEEEAERRFETWLTDKEAKIQAKKERLGTEADKNSKKLLEAESKVNEQRLAAQTARNAALAREANAKTEKVQEASASEPTNTVQEASASEPTDTVQETSEITPTETVQEISETEQPSGEEAES